MDIRTEIEKQEAQRQASLAVEEAREGMLEAAEHGQEAVGRLSKAWQSARSRVQESTTAGVRATDHAIREYPYPSLGIAFAAGFLVGLIISRR